MRGRLWVEEKRVLCSGPFPKPCFAGFFRTCNVAAIQQQKLKIPAPRPRIRPPRLFVGEARFLKSPDVKTNRRDPIVGLLEIWLNGQHLPQRFESLSMLDILRRAPKNKCPRQMSLRQGGIKHQSSAAVVFRLLQPAGPRVEAEVHVRQDVRQPGMGQCELGRALWPPTNAG